ncbi:MAG: hypothetical protein HRU19_03840 [Pseudobacteriovorax sp.]|nr:hypothetical protein [Pseudobacteriovorax sp.]
MTKNDMNFVNDLQAANQTIRVLKDKVRKLYSSESSSIIHRQLVVSKKRAEDLQRSQHEAMKQILDHVIFGFFIIDRNHVVQKGFSRSVFDLLGQTKVEGRQVGDILKLDTQASDYFVLCVDEVFEDLLPESVTLQQIPSKFRNGERILKLEGKTVRNEQGKVDRILFTLTDITELEKATRQAQRNEMLVTILKTRDAFQEFLVETKRGFANVLSLSVAHEQIEIRRFLHTIKGNYASFGMFDLVETVHEAEGLETLNVRDVQFLENQLREFLDTNWDIIEISYDDVDGAHFAISDSQLGTLKQIIQNLPKDSQRQFQVWTQGISQKPAGTLLGPIEEFSSKLAHRLGKDIHLEVIGRNTLVDVDLMRPVFQNITHLIRNSIDHGIEEFHQRLALGKDRLGKISIRIESDDSQYIVEVSDDGGGINTACLCRAAVDQGIVTSKSSETMTDEQKLNLIFVDGLSSAEFTNEISGRGIGMPSVKAIVHSLNGNLNISSKEGVGTKFRIEIPRANAFQEQERKTS